MAVPQLQNQNGGEKATSNTGNVSNPSGSAGQQLVDFLPNLEDYTTTIPDAATSAFLSSAGFSSNDPRIVRLISIAGQKFISDITLDALQHCKVRTSNQSSKSKTKERTFTFTMEDLAPALAERGITVRKPPYFV
ncbi:hypothetical protein GE061_006555 [Apolygus lucorum]|uniref:Uncharacterized protein n=1 Tax=Apolygus lucorum TaxID=248454 RepID=A0A6A4J8L2_APOLU|nr:hypothetical protein GE061_006555 [Apolygus lucorum]